MLHYQYLIVGGGMTADAATKGIRTIDQQGSIGLFSAEPHPPYNRPPLSKKLWLGGSLGQIWRGVEQRRVDLHLNCKIAAIDLESNSLTDQAGNSFTYDKLLLATGGSPRRLPFGEDQIIYYRTLEDYCNLRRLAENGRRFAVIGGGFIGSEIAAALALNDQQVTLVFPEQGIGARLFPPDLAEYVTNYYREKGVSVLNGQLVRGLEQRNGHLALLTGNGQEIEAEVVVAGLGIQPNTALAEQAGLEVDNGIVVDEFLQTSAHGIYAAGDVASFYNPLLDRYLRVEHEDNANSMGMLAGQNMARDYLSETCQPYYHLPFFYSDLFDLGYEAVGELDPSLETFADWREPYRKGVIYYLHAGRVRGVLLWNVWGQVEQARELIASPGPISADNLTGRIRD